MKKIRIVCIIALVLGYTSFCFTQTESYKPVLIIDTTLSNVYGMTRIGIHFEGLSDTSKVGVLVGSFMFERKFGGAWQRIPYLGSPSATDYPENLKKYWRKNDTIYLCFLNLFDSYLEDTISALSYMQFGGIAQIRFSGDDYDKVTGSYIPYSTLPKILQVPPASDEELDAFRFLLEKTRNSSTLKEIFWTFASLSYRDRTVCKEIVDTYPNTIIGKLVKIHLANLGCDEIYKLKLTSPIMSKAEIQQVYQDVIQSNDPFIKRFATVIPCHN